MTLQVHQKVVLSSRFAKNVVTFNYAGDALSLLTELGLTSEPLPKVIFADLNMPFMNGWKFLEEFERLNCSKKQEIMVFVLSSSLDQENMKRAKNYGCVTDFIPKPLTLAKLASLTKRTL
jgi:CheY-like chemotaxis protein